MEIQERKYRDVGSNGLSCAETVVDIVADYRTEVDWGTYRQSYASSYRCKFQFAQIWRSTTFETLLTIRS